jgi:hypothetical protein
LGEKGVNVEINVETGASLDTRNSPLLPYNFASMKRLVEVL